MHSFVVDRNINNEQDGVYIKEHKNRSIDASADPAWPQTQTNDWQSLNQNLIKQNNNLRLENEELVTEITEALNENDIIKLHMKEYSTRQAKSMHTMELLVDEIEILREQHRHTDEFIDFCNEHGVIERTQKQSPNEITRNVEKLAQELLIEKDELQLKFDIITIELGEAIQTNNEMKQVLEHLKSYAKNIMSEKRSLEVQLHESLIQNLQRPTWIDNLNTIKNDTFLQ